MAKRLYVGNLPHSLGNNELQNLFQTHGTVLSAQVIIDRETNRSKGFGFVEMSNADEAQAAITALNGSEVGGRTLTVNEARPQAERTGGGGGGGNRSGGGGGMSRGGPRGGSGGGRRF